MEASIFVHPLVGMGAEVIPLSLEYIGVASGCAVRIKIGQGAA